LHRSEFLFSKVIDLTDMDALTELFAQEKLSRASIDILLINTVIPYKYAYACAVKSTDRQSAFQSALDIIERIAAEDNTVIRQWRMLGQQVRNAADTQALLHLYQNYCQHHECINCEVGYRIFFVHHLAAM
jgi:hypothetical protein